MTIDTIISLASSSIIPSLALWLSYHIYNSSKPKIKLKYEKGKRDYIYIINEWKSPIQIRKITLSYVDGKERPIKTSETECLPYILEWYTGKKIEVPSLAIKLDPLYTSPQEIIVEDALWKRHSLKLNPKEHPGCFRD